MATPNNIDPKDIRAHWAEYQGDKYVDGWASLWDKYDNLPWDRGFPNPALEDTLVQRAGTIGKPITQDGQRRKALVPGCGRGVDVLLLASFGYDAYGLEVSATAVDACKKEEKENPSWYRVRDEKAGKGKVTFVQGDFFDDTWLKEIGVPRNGFDIIYDYTISYNDKGLVNADPLREPSKAGLERVAYWQPERTHAVGKGENGVIHDRVSIWRRRD
ncbi:hypothetical protein N7481_002509 [Penicillium waksmanii]|uniref:uncharacterized protein n=1 Tax=Penicillium waksmanii TaxID=69791 RepID=UPI0025469575|nr:uncharacterized protein N7481_002509 [Penicillium waksmanii]KAJ5995532.1 hypothetical protein N7481_002509 [Penicillium waksmanii]